jgi:peptide-methionine (S)-S-oxide reductase
MTVRQFASLSLALLLAPAALLTPLHGEPAMTEKSTPTSSTLQKATFGTGCFWCTEAIFERLDGVKSATSGYTGGKVKNPTYEQVCSGSTGHAEVIQVEFDPSVISYEKLLAVFWKAHDPTTLNRQGNDVGTQYRSAIFYHNEAQKTAAEKSKAEEAKEFPSPIVTEITAIQEFYPAEDYHQDYFRLNGHAPYCSFVIRPKVQKLQEKKVIP